METIFHRIVRKDLPAYIIAEDEQHIAFLDIFPKQPGQTLVLPKVHTTSQFSVANPEILTRTMVFAQKVAAQIETKMPAVQRCIAVIEGFEVDYLHIKLYPIAEKPHTDEPEKATDEELIAWQELLKFEV